MPSGRILFFFLFTLSFSVFVLHPYLVLRLNCPAFCLYLQHKHPCSRRDFFCFLALSVFQCSDYPDFLPFVLTVQHTQHRHPRLPQDSNPQPQQAIGADPRLRPLYHRDRRKVTYTHVYIYDVTMTCKLRIAEKGLCYLRNATMSTNTI
jgi:hypothetical protein